MSSRQAGQRARRPDLPVAEIVAAGAQRIGVGGSLAWAAVEAMAAAAERIRDTGDPDGLGDPPG